MTYSPPSAITIPPISTATQINIDGILKGSGGKFAQAVVSTDFVGTDDARLSDARPPRSHNHAPADITGTAVITNDARLSDARTPLSHTHTEANITNLTTDLAGKAAASHTHAESDITNLATDLSGKAPTVHTHSYQPLGFTILANDTLAQALATNINTRVTVTAGRTLTTTVPAAGIRCTVEILTSGTSSYTVTFGTGFKPVGTLATGTTTGRIFSVNFLSDGTYLHETGRTGAMVA